ncbi:hypothetical protein KFU94_01625 [Chloroflexi bacterium TSY]|nr:hypothetical protein [Chloroflexi bacterium TSY]
MDITADGGRFVFTSEPLGGNIPQIWVADINPDSTDGAPSISDVTLSPNYVLTDGSTASTFSAKVTGGDDGPPKTCFETFKEGVYQGADVLVNHVMFDNGTNGDVTAGDGVYTIEGVRGERIEPGEYAIRMHAAVPRHVMAIHAGPLTVSTEPICYTLTLSHTGSGSDPVTTPNKSSGCGQVGEFVVNESITLTANPAAGWAVSNWRGTDDDSSMASSNTLTMPAADHTVQVVYQGMETPTVVPIATPPSVQSNADTFESDNSCAEARTITPNGTRQEHSFHNEGDTDWLRFDAESGQKYRIEVQTRANSRADVTLEVYSECGGSLESKFEETFTPGVRLDLSSTSNTTLYLKIFNFDPKVFGAEAVYSVSVTQRQSNKGAVILLEGRLKMNDRLQSNIHNVIQRAYHLFKDNGYSDDEIYYMGFDPSASGYDAAASSTNLQTAITTWAQDKVGPNNPLTIYLMDHGGLDNFYVDEPNGVRLRPQDLDAWLTELQTKKPGLKINVIIEACNSGSFIDGDESISGEDRLIITSTNAKNVAYASAEGAQFSDRFLTSLREGYGMSNSFWDAQFSVNRLYSLQQPWIDANGNGIPNEAADGGKVTSDHNPATDNLPADTWAPYIVKVEGPQVIANGTGTLRAEVRDNKSVKKVWATVYAPSAELPTRAEELVPEDVPIIDFQTLGSDLFSGTFDDFTEVGTYQIAFYAEDNDGLKARLAVLEVGMGTTIYLPLVDR